MARKSKTTKRKAKVEITPSDYRYPGESGVYWTGVAGVFILFIWIVVMFLFFAKTPAQTIRWQWIYLFLWPFAAIFGANYLSAKPRYAQIKRLGRQARVLSTTNPDLFSLLQQEAQLFGFKKPPDLYIMEDDAAFIYSIAGKAGAVIVSRPVIKALTRDEFGALLGRELGALAAHNVRLGLAITWIQHANPLLKVVFLPLTLMSTFMRGWVDLCELTADRAAVLVAGAESIVNLALVKFIVAQDPQAEIDHAELEAYLGGSADISTDAKQLERHFRIGTFIDGQPDLRERVEQITEYRKSPQGKKAFEKLTEIRGGG